ncbi:MAG: polysaccharide biosynthesis tyrosine autokinase [Armatimonadetes bacterium]|nr:polysaccharide biosynthesis tyrosine autokinase [Armatimonadota bacterium]NIM24834.1 polysaccharide biosynthesis tyrosine autokinase [Armatimonadota bacterium]NIM68724.1 polysaccharide biosynthesis tyrosine autokinase [Armatimonadota bacterium]NIM76017.1 polysaccharide biosynthesis tyrosine autokinase [Armatimonadota bacterium]NIN06921.1 polysaccharide biosynthesis tyrosine autokinase [Armatimonadota bacterium]
MSDFSDESKHHSSDGLEPSERSLALAPRVPSTSPPLHSVAVAEGAPYQNHAYSAMEGSENLAEYVMILRRRWKVIAAFALGTFLLAAILTALMKPVYRATSKLIFENRPGAMQMFGQAAASAALVSRLGTQVELISGRETSNKVANLLKTEHDLDLPPEAIQASLRASAIEDTELVKIDVYQGDPEVAQLLANTIAMAFVEWSEERLKKGGRETAEYLSRQLRVAKQELLTAENALREFKEEKRVVSLNQETSNRLARIAKLEEDAAITLADLMATEKRLERAHTNLSAQNARLAAGGTIRDNALIGSLRAKLVDLEERLATAQERYTNRYPGVIDNLENQIADTREVLNREIRAVITGTAGELAGQQAAVQELTRLEGEAMALRARRRALAGMSDRENAALATVPADELELARLSRATEIAAKIYTSLLERNQEAKINQVMEVGNVQVAEAAVLPISPIKPRKGLNLAFGLLCGILLGLAVAFLLEFMDDSVKDATEATRSAQAPLLGIIPLTEMESQLIAISHPKSPITEAYRTLRSNVVFTGVGVKVPAVLVTSPGVGEGKSSTAANLAVTMAQTGKRVILVDSDLRRPVQHKFFKTNGGPGLTDVVLGNCGLEDALYPTSVDGLRVMPCGPLPPNPAELIDSQHMVGIIEELKKRADVIFFDSPPLVPVTDALLLSTYCDKVLLICESGETSRQAVARARQLLEQARVPIAGVVLNKFDPIRHGRYYDSSYYYYYHYHNEIGQSKRKRRHHQAPALPAALMTETHQRGSPPDTRT